MLEGLEISELSLIESLADNEDFRFDSEFFWKRYLREDLLRKKYVNTNIGSFAFVTDGQHGYHEIDENSSIHMLTAKNAKKWFADLDGAEPLAKWVDDNNRRSSLENGDVILSTRGTIGCCAMVTSDILPANIDQDVARIKIESTGILSEYVLTYVNSKFGQDWMCRNKTGMVQQGLSLQKVRTMPIPVLSTNFQNKIKDQIRKSHKTLLNAVSEYNDAEDILLSELGLNDWKPSNQASTTKSFADFQESGRLDAEYYQPKYSDLFAHLKKYETKPLNKIATINKSIEPGSDAYQEGGIPFVRVSNLSKFGLTEPDIHLDRATYETTKLKPKKDTILLSKDGSVGIAYKLEQDLDAITSGAILHLKITDNEFWPDYVTLVLNSIIVKMQAERDAGGSIIQHWKPSEIEQVIIPKLSQEQQMQIADKIQESFALKAESKRLLDLAKTAVEIAIEQGEHKALELLKQN